VRLDDSVNGTSTLTLPKDVTIESYPTFLFFLAGDESGETAVSLTGSQLKDPVQKCLIKFVNEHMVMVDDEGTYLGKGSNDSDDDVDVDDDGNEEGKDDPADEEL
jgi:hypothetical protein